MEPTTRYDDGEALRMLLDNVGLLDSQAHQLLLLSGRLTHTTWRFVEAAVLEEEPEGAGDPGPLLRELGAALELGGALGRALGGLAEAVHSLGFAWTPREPDHPEINREEMKALRRRLKATGELRRRPNRSPKRG